MVGLSCCGRGLFGAVCCSLPAVLGDKNAVFGERKVFRDPCPRRRRGDVTWVDFQFCPRPVRFCVEPISDKYDDGLLFRDVRGDDGVEFVEVVSVDCQYDGASSIWHTYEVWNTLIHLLDRVLSVTRRRIPSGCHAS